MAVSKYDITLNEPTQADTSHFLLAAMIGHDKTVLDVGCDTGYLGEYLAKAGNTCWGFELNEASAAVARTRYQGVEVGDLEAVDLDEVFGGRRFDVVVFADVLEHLRDPLPVLRRAATLLAPGGAVLVSVPNIAHGDLRLNLLRGRFDYTPTGLLDDTHTRFFTRETLLDFVNAGGFAATQLRRTRQPMFQTEVGLRREDFAPGLVAEIETDPEALTYQFVARLVPLEAAPHSDGTCARPELDDTLLDQHRMPDGGVGPNTEHLLWGYGVPAAGDDATFALRHAVLRARDRAVAAEGHLRHQQPEIIALRGELAGVRDELAREHAQLVSTQEQLAAAEARAAALASVREQLVTARSQTAQARAQVDALRRSRTWKVGSALIRPAARVSRWVSR